MVSTRRGQAPNHPEMASTDGASSDRINGRYARDHINGRWQRSLRVVSFQVVDVPDALEGGGDQRRDGNDRPIRLPGLWQRVAHPDALDRPVVQLLRRAGDEQPVGRRNEDLWPRARVKQGPDCCGDRSAGRDHVIDDQARSIADVAHDLERSGLSPARPALVDDRRGRA